VIYNWNEYFQLVLTAVLIMHEGVQSFVLLSMERVQPDGTDSCIDHAGGSSVGRAGVNGPARQLY
jgi:hypothetical protein